MHSGATDLEKVADICGDVGVEAIIAHRDWEAFGLPLAGGVEDQPARWYSLVTTYGSEAALLVKKEREANGHA